MSKGIHAFVDTLASAVSGRIVICNIVNAYDEKLIDATFMAELMDWWSALFVWRLKNQGIPATVQSLLGTLEMLVFEAIPDTFRAGVDKPEFRLRGPRTTLPKRNRPHYAHVTNAEFFYDVLLTERKRKNLAKLGRLCFHREPGSGGKIRKTTLQPTDFDNGKYRLGRVGGVVFITPMKGLDAIGAKTKPANAARDLLGLIDRGNGYRQLALTFRCPSLDSSQCARPVCADAGKHRRFKAVADTARNKNRRVWGFTADLERFAEGKRCIDGLPEQVALPIAFDRLEAINYLDLGAVDDDRGMMGDHDDDEHFLSHLVGKGRKFDTLKARLLSIL